MYLMRNHDVWIYVRCANSDPCIAFDRLYDLIDEAAGHGFLVRGTSFDHCSGNTLKEAATPRKTAVGCVLCWTQKRTVGLKP